MNSTRRKFIVGLALAIATSNAIAKAKTFNEQLCDEIKVVLKKYAHDKDNVATCNFIEAEIDDIMHMHVVAGEILNFKVKCYHDKMDHLCVACFIKKTHTIGDGTVLSFDVS